MARKSNEVREHEVVGILRQYPYLEPLVMYTVLKKWKWRDKPFVPVQVQLKLHCENFHTVLYKPVRLSPLLVPVQAPFRLCVNKVKEDYVWQIQDNCGDKYPNRPKYGMIVDRIILITARKRSLRRICFLHLSASHSVHRGGGGLHPGGSASRGARSFIQGVGVGRPHRIQRDTVNERYASYWNTFLFIMSPNTDPLSALSTSPPSKPAGWKPVAPPTAAKKPAAPTTTSKPASKPAVPATASKPAPFRSPTFAFYWPRLTT